MYYDTYVVMETMSTDVGKLELHFPVCKREGCENVLYMHGHKLIFTLFPVSHNPSRKKQDIFTAIF